MRKHLPVIASTALPSIFITCHSLCKLSKQHRQRLSAIGNGGFANSLRTWITALQFNPSARLLWRVRHHNLDIATPANYHFGVEPFNLYNLFRFPPYYSSWLILPDILSTSPHFGECFNYLNKLSLLTTLNKSSTIKSMLEDILYCSQPVINMLPVQEESSEYAAIHIRDWAFEDYSRSSNIDYGAYIARPSMTASRLGQLLGDVSQEIHAHGIKKLIVVTNNRNSLPEQIYNRYCDKVQIISSPPPRASCPALAVFQDFQVLRKSKLLYRPALSTFSQTAHILASDSDQISKVYH
jgi:hypothetical protein